MPTWEVKKDKGLFLFAAILKGQFPLKITKPSPPNDTPTLLALYVEMVLFYAIPPDIKSCKRSYNQTIIPCGVRQNVKIYVKTTEQPLRLLQTLLHCCTVQIHAKPDGIARL